jgi:hypothetical protein
VLFGGTGAGAATIDPSHLINAGVGVGPVHLGESIGDVIAVLGKPKSVKPYHGRIKAWEGLRMWSWADEAQEPSDKARVINGGLVVLTQDDAVRVVIVYYDGHYQDTNGLHTLTMEHEQYDPTPGSTPDEVIAALGKPVRTVTIGTTTILIYPGMEFYYGSIHWYRDVRNYVFEIAVVDN